ncbi:MAG: four helix bundle protein [Alphaproteobacteria bacterium]|nr:MAG: four helix bundle protein [Alphaproteobacteria bacterium]
MNLDWIVAEGRAPYKGSAGFQNLKVWQLAMDLVVAIYEATAEFPASERFGLTSQIRRAAVSVPSNVAEGNGRTSRKEYAYHVSVASGSLRELQSQIILAGRLGLLHNPDPLADQCETIGRMLTQLRKYLETGN